MRVELAPPLRGLYGGSQIHTGSTYPTYVAPMLPKIPIRCITMCSLFSPTWFAWMGVFAGATRGRGDASIPAHLHSAPTRWATGWLGSGRCKHPHPSPLRPRPYAGGILIHPRFGQNTAHAHFFFHLSLNNAMGHLMRGDGCKHMSRKRLPACCVSCALLTLSPTGDSRSWGKQ